MKFDILKTRRVSLGDIEQRLLNKTLGQTEINELLRLVDKYEKNNLDTIEKLKRKKMVDVNKINGALKQAINAQWADN